LIFLLCTPAHSETGNTLLQACEVLERERHVSKKVKFGCQRELRFTDVGAI
jgi:hypothetical protein